MATGFSFKSALNRAAALPLLAVALLTGCASFHPTPFFSAATSATTQVQHERDELCRTFDLTDAQLCSIESDPGVWEPRSHLDPHAGSSLLVVFTYGNLQPGTGWGNGLRDMADELRRRYPAARVITRGCFDHDGIARTLESHAGPIVLIGHSFGGGKSIELCSHLHRNVDWLLLLDPVPTNDWAIRHDGKYFTIPPTVHHALCFYRPEGIWPLSYPMLNPNSPGDNHLRRIDHSAFCRDPEVRHYLLQACEQLTDGSEQLAADLRR